MPQDYEDHGCGECENYVTPVAAAMAAMGVSLSISASEHDRKRDLKPDTRFHKKHKRSCRRRADIKIIEDQLEG